MISSAFNIIEEMPLTSSGKINRQALEKYGRSYHALPEKLFNLIPILKKAMIAIMENIFKLHIGINNSYTSVGAKSIVSYAHCIQDTR